MHIDSHSGSRERRTASRFGARLPVGWRGAVHRLARRPGSNGPRSSHQSRGALSVLTMRPEPAYRRERMSRRSGMGEALGMIENRGLLAMIEASDATVNAGVVRL